MEEDIFNTEFGKKFLALIKASFRVSDLIPDLVLREKIKTQILSVYENFFSSKGESVSGGEYSNLLKEINVLDNFFFLAGQLNFVKDNHLRVLRNGFLVFKSRIVLAMNESGKSNVEGMVESKNLNAKQKKIMEKFDSKDILKLAEILEIFPGVSEKTIRNELSSLIGLKKVTRSGQGNGSFYQIIR